MEPTQEQILNAAIFLDGEHPEVAAMLVRMAEQPKATEPVAYINSNGIAREAGYKGWLDKEVLRPLVYGDAAQCGHGPCTESKS